MISGVYRVDYAPSSASICQTPACKHADCKIRKGAIRIGVMVSIPNKGSKGGGHEMLTAFKWRHLWCMTPQTIKNMKESFSEDAEDYDGWDDLNEDDRATFKAFFDKGEIPEDDFPDWLWEDRELAMILFSDKKDIPYEEVEAKCLGIRKSAGSTPQKGKGKKDEDEDEDEKPTPPSSSKKEAVKKAPAKSKKRKVASSEEEESELSDAETSEDEEEDIKPKAKSKQTKQNKKSTPQKGRAKKVKAEQESDGAAPSDENDDSLSEDNDIATSEEEVMPKGKNRGKTNGSASRGRGASAGTGRGRGRGRGRGTGSSTTVQRRVKAEPKDEEDD